MNTLRHTLAHSPEKTNGISKTKHCTAKTDIAGKQTLGTFLLELALPCNEFAIVAGYPCSHRQTRRKKCRNFRAERFADFKHGFEMTKLTAQL
jgi:hypothetical protein